jgi:hypothetical protein
MQKFLAMNKILTIPQSLYSPVLRLFNFWPFLTLTTGLNGRHLEYVVVKLNAIAGLTAIPNSGFQNSSRIGRTAQEACMCRLAVFRM